MDENHPLVFDSIPWRVIEERLEIERQMLELVDSLKEREPAGSYGDEDWTWAKRKLRSNLKRK